MKCLHCEMTSGGHALHCPLNPQNQVVAFDNSGNGNHGVISGVKPEAGYEWEGYKVPPDASDDMKLIHVLGQALERHKNAPPRHLIAALKWFREYADAVIDDLKRAQR